MARPADVRPAEPDRGGRGGVPRRNRGRTERRRAVETIAELLRSLGHEVAEREVTYTRLAMRSTTVRYLVGVHDDVATFGHPERLDPRTRRLARLGGLVPRRLVRSARRDETRLAASIDRIFDGADVVLTPVTASAPPRLADTDHRSGLRCLHVSNNGAWTMPWNAIGRPAASVPAGLDTGGLPLAVQLCGRRDDDHTLLRLAHEIETARPWTSLSPP